MSHPAVVKATKIANRAVEQGWKGTLDSAPLSGHRKTVLILKRNDEKLIIDWYNSHFERATYSILNSFHHITDLVEIKQIVMGWPDIINLLATNRDYNPIKLTDTYVRLPFNWETDDDETIINCLVGKHIWWWEFSSQRICTDTVLRRQNSKCRIAPVGHRKLFHFNGSEAGFRSILLDMVLKVA